MALKLHNRGWYPFIFLIGAAAIIGAWFYFGAGDRPEFLISIAGCFTGFIYFLYRQHLDETKLFKELFHDFNARYNDLNEELNAILFGSPDGPLSPAERECLFNYFNLCAEEYFFYKAGYIDHHVWASWLRGMKVFFKHPRIHALWEEDCRMDSYYSFRPPQ